MSAARCLIAACALWLVASPLAADDTRIPIAGNTTLRYYGWFHFANQSVDDGVQTTSNIVDVTNANTRVGFYLEGGSPLSFHFETALGFRQSQKTSQVNTPAFWDWNRKALRKVQVVYGGDMGVMKLGQGSMATDGAAENDLGGTVIVAKSTIPESHGAFLFRETNGALSTVTVGDVFSNFDGGRRFRLRYDTPKISGFSFAIAYGKEVLTSGVNDRYYDFALRYDAALTGFDIKAALGASYTDRYQGPTTGATTGSVSALHTATGLNLSVAGGRVHQTGARFVYLKAGWNADLFRSGTTKLIAEGYWGDGQQTAGSQSGMWGLAAIQEFRRQNLEIYAGYRAFSYSAPLDPAYHDIGAWQIGARWRY